MTDPWAPAPRILLLAGLGLWLWGLVGGLVLSQGHLAYTLDDAWIHLQLAEQLADGHLGLQPGVTCAPSSSALWPFLLVPFAGTALMPWMPLLLAALCLVAALWLLGRLLFPAGEDSGVPIRAVALAVLAVSNLAGLALSGMEHSLQVLLALALLWVLGRRGRERKPVYEGLFGLLCLLGPLVRYEMLALVLPAILLDPAPGVRLRERITRLALALLPLMAFSFWLHGRGLGWLPASLAAKSDLVAARGITGQLRALLANAVHNLQLPQGRVLGGLALLLALAARLSACSPVTRRLALWMALALGLHLAAGRTGWLDRYEIQVWLPGLVVLVLALRELDPVRRLGLPARPALLAATGVLVLAGLPYLRTTLASPWAMANIHQQQQQMARFARDHWRAPVAVNDIGCVTWRNPWPVLDLWGLSSPEALVARSADSGGDWADTLARRRGVELVMIYPDWFRSLPAGWIPLGTLHLGSPRVSSDRDAVAFFALDPKAAIRARRALAGFLPGLPPGVEFRPVPLSIQP